MRTTSNQTRFGDEDVLWRVESYLCSKHFPAFRSLEIDVKDGVVTISGKLENFHERQVALNCCRRVAGVMHLIDEIKVEAGEHGWLEKANAG